MIAITERELRKMQRDLIEKLYDQMGSIFPDDAEVDLSFYDAKDIHSNGDGLGKFTLYLDSPQVDLVEGVDAVKLFRDWAAFCTAAADNIEAAQKAGGAMAQSAA